MYQVIYACTQHTILQSIITIITIQLLCTDKTIIHYKELAVPIKYTLLYYASVSRAPEA